MRKVVIAKATFLMAFGLYLAIGMTREPQSERHAAHPFADAKQELMR